MRTAARNQLKRPDSTKPSPQPETAEGMRRPMTGFFASLTPDQQKAALSYTGPENHGNAEFRLDKS
jgi:hypothetical protein